MINPAMVEKWVLTKEWTAQRRCHCEETKTKEVAQQNSWAEQEEQSGGICEEGSNGDHKL